MRSLAASGSLQPLMQPVDVLTTAEHARHAALAATGDIASFLQFQPPAQHRSGFHYHSIEEYHAAFLSGRTTPLQIAERLIAFLKDQKLHLNAVTELNEADVLAQAAASTARFQAGAPIGVWMDVNGVVVMRRRCV